MLEIQLFYVVRTAETLNEIARRWELPVKSLIAANHLVSPYTLFEGQQLSIPPGVNVYRVKSGDSVYGIAKTYGVPLAVIIEANELKAPYMLQVGQLLKVPPGVPFYTVQPGETLNEIASRYNVIIEGQSNPELIMEINELTSTAIESGMKLMISYAPPSAQGFIAYTANRGGGYDIWTYNMQSGEHKKLTNDLADLFSKPVWSHDSSRLAFVGKDNILYVIYLENGLIAAIDQLAEDGDFSLDWSPDSSSLAYTARGIIILYNATLHEAATISQPGASDVQWFPNGTELLIQAPDASGISQLFRINTSGTDKRQITKNTGGPLHDARLSPDGTFALYTTPGASISMINTISLSTGSVYEVKGGPQSKKYFPEWSPDSLQIAYSATDFEDRGYFSQIRTAGRQGENDQIWAISNCYSTPITWSTDGKKLAYLSGCQEQEMANEMWVIDVTHPAPAQLITGVNITSLQWSPTPVLDLAKNEFTSEVFDVNFEYPASWEKVSNERYEGSDGFFQISALFGSDNISEVCHAEAFQSSIPYGSTPEIIMGESLYEETCTILPSADQPAVMNNQAAYIAKYPSPMTIGDANYNYFILWADRAHIEEIASTLMFLP